MTLTPLDYARSQVGVAESGGANRGEPFTRYALIGEEPLPWCARFVRWCWENAGTPLPGNRWLLGSVAELRDALTACGALVSPADARAGDIVGWRSRLGSDRGTGNHVSIVEAVSPTYLDTIDGNWDDRVARVQHRRDDPRLWFVARWPLEVTT